MDHLLYLSIVLIASTSTSIFDRDMVFEEPFIAD
jgi:hypothetical protein